jgi:hypothetical protein
MTNASLFVNLILGWHQKEKERCTKSGKEFDHGKEGSAEGTMVRSNE